MKMTNLILVLLLFASCGESVPDDDDSDKKENQINETREQIIKRHVEAKLSIPATEKYSLKIYEQDLNGDDSLDVIITVNRLEKAIDEAIESGNPAKRAEVGYIGNFNYIFYMDGATKDVTPAIAVPSSPHAELTVSFAHIKSEAYLDFMVDFKIRNAGYRRFFTVFDRTPRQTFETKIYDGFGTDDGVAFVIEFEPGTYSLAKNIVVMKGILAEVKTEIPEEIYKIIPNIQKTDVVDRKWFYNVREAKYFTISE